MANKSTAPTFENLFEGMDVSPDFQSKLKQVFDNAVTKKIQECNMSSAPKSDDDEELEEGNEITALSDEENMNEAETPETADAEPEALANDLEIRKILNALRINPAAFARSLSGTISDVEGNPVAGAAFAALMEILQAIADDPTIANRLAAYLKKKSNDSEADPTMEEDVDSIPGTVEDDLNEIDLMGMDEELVESVDQYLTYVAESWVADNQLALEEGIKTELTESFLIGLKNLFVEHNINVPEQADVMDSLVAKVATLEEQAKVSEVTYKNKLNEETEKVIRFKNKLNVQVASKIFEKVCADSKLSLTQKEKFKTLTESIQFSDEKAYQAKLQNLVSNVETDKKTKVRLTEESLQTNEKLDPVMSVYAKAITNNSKF